MTGGLEFLTPAQCAEVLGVSVSLIRAMLRDGRLRARRLRGSRLIRIAREDVLALLEPLDQAPSVDRALRVVR